MFEWMTAILDFWRFSDQIMGKFFGARISFQVYKFIQQHAKFDTFVRHVNISVKFVPKPSH